jgi:hypothetical protein
MSIARTTLSPASWQSRRRMAASIMAFSYSYDGRFEQPMIDNTKRTNYEL